MRLQLALVRIIFAALLLLGPTVARAAKTVVDACGMEVRGGAVLAADLDCSTHPGHALVLHGRLELGGHTIVGNPAGYSVVDCSGKCGITIKGPGSIVGGSSGVSGGRVSLSGGVIVRDAAEWGVVGGRVQIRSSELVNNGFGLPIGPTGGGGVAGGAVAVSRSTIRLNGSFGIDAYRASLVSSAAVQNGLIDVRAYSLPRLRDSTCMVSGRGDLSMTWGICLDD